MELKFVDEDLRRLYTDLPYRAGLSLDLVKSFRKKVNFVQQAQDERALYGMKSLHFERLAGNRSHQHSVRLNDQYRLIVELEGQSSSKCVVIVAIEDYH